MNPEPIPLLYLLGAGRSGTTVTASVLNAQEQIHTAGELHQFVSHLRGDRVCSCGEQLNSCEFWGSISRNYSDSGINLDSWQELNDKKEAHRNIPWYLINTSSATEYSNLQTQLLHNIQKQIAPASWILDSSKYIARYLLLRKNKNLKLKGIYMVRDVRGVVHSFSKNVQSRRGPWLAVVYYNLINFFGQLVCWTDSRVIKVRYEDLVLKQEHTLNRILDHVLGEFSSAEPADEFDMPHIIGGNRMRTNRKISLRLDEQWRQSTSRIKQIGLYLLALPFMLINGYKI